MAKAKTSKTSTKSSTKTKTQAKTVSRKKSPSKSTTTSARPAKSAGLSVGAKVPDFEIASSAGDAFRLSEQKGRTVVLYFYPKDMTPGCTIESQEFNEWLPEFRKMKADVYGVSRDSVASHCKFSEKYGFRFPLLSDPDEQVCRIFDVIKEKNMYGRKVMGIERSTFVIGPDGRLTHEFRKVKAEGHAKSVLEALRA